MSEGPTVHVVGSSTAASIDASGGFTLAGVPTGDIQLQFSGAGLNAQLTLLGVNDHETIQLTVTIAGASASAETTERLTSDNHVQLEGRIATISSSAHTFALLDSTVVVGADTRVWDGAQTLQFADIKVNDRVHVSGTKTAATTVAASEVIFQTAKPALPLVQLNGLIAGLAGACPTVTFTVNSTKVSTDAATQIAPGSCSELANGVAVHLEGASHADGSVTALRIEMPSGAGNNRPTELAGPIAGLTGTCPAISFTLGATKVTTNAGTSFANVACSALVTGTTVSVQGTSQSDGTVTATRLEKTGH